MTTMNGYQKNIYFSYKQFSLSRMMQNKFAIAILLAATVCADQVINLITDSISSSLAVSDADDHEIAQGWDLWSKSFDDDVTTGWYCGKNVAYEFCDDPQDRSCTYGNVASGAGTSASY